MKGSGTKNPERIGVNAEFKREKSVKSLEWIEKLIEILSEIDMFLL